MALSAGGVSANSPEASVTTVASPPAAPTIGMLPVSGKVTISLVKAGATNGAAITGYNIYRSTASGGQGNTPVASNVALPYDDTTVSNGTKYYYTAAAVNSAGAGSQSAEVNGTPGTLTKPGPGLLVSDDVGQGSTSQTTGWSPNTFTFSPASTTITNHNAIAGPDGTTLDASTIRLNTTSSSSGFAAVECATTNPPGTGVAVTGSIWLRGKLGGEGVYVGFWDASHGNGSGGRVVLTTSWQKFTFNYTAANATKIAMSVTGGNDVADVTFDAAWPNAKLA